MGEELDDEDDEKEDDGDVDWEEISSCVVMGDGR